MASQKLQNYLKLHRRRTGLTQGEIAYLLGFDNKGVVSRYEKRTRIPPLQTAIACEAVFGVPISELFAGMREDAKKDIQKRLLELRSRLRQAPLNEARTDNGAVLRAHKLQWLGGRLGSVVAGDKQTK